MTSFRIVTILAITLKAIWFLLPQVEYSWMTEDAIVVMSYSGFESELNIAPWISWSYFAVTVGVLALFLRFGHRIWLFVLVYFLASVFVFVPFGGMIVETGLSMTIRDLGNFALGSAVAIAYMQSMEQSAAIASESRAEF